MRAASTVRLYSAGPVVEQSGVSKIIDSTAMVTAWDGLHGVVQPIDGELEATIDDITLHVGGWMVEALEVGVLIECRILAHDNGTRRVISVFNIGVAKS